MKLRTVIEDPSAAPFTIGHDDSIVMLGSCFTDEVGVRLDDDGFNVIHNPMGPLYNPVSIARALTHRHADAGDLYLDNTGTWHCTDYASRFSGDSAEAVLSHVNDYRDRLNTALDSATAMIVTFGTARVYEFLPTGRIAGNCHRLHPSLFKERLLGIDEIAEMWTALRPSLPNKLILTLSPVRHTADGLARNSLSKSLLRVAIDRICEATDAVYFPAFEILNDDLRDYRFYADDLKHPSAMAVEYIYEYFGRSFFTGATLTEAGRRHRETMRSRHNPDYHAK